MFSLLFLVSSVFSRVVFEASGISSLDGWVVPTGDLGDWEVTAGRWYSDESAQCNFTL